ncbi:uncharacterized protein LOC126841913 isoform X2 [Adelges cooleyi]|uniref:uncharacterized protein LOC126841913 isoform X2 n=1 Tax=Adelges cooleyi TaxID=133065 RepID=UPI00217FAF75|nr:uncharacterized protein LOC126841913 isoform X2 [Adelges cooleyi]
MQGFKILCIATCTLLVLDVLEAVDQESVKDVNTPTEAFQDKKEGKMQKASSYFGNVAESIKSKMNKAKISKAQADGNVEPTKPISSKMTTTFTQAKNALKTNFQENASKLRTGLHRTKEIREQTDGNVETTKPISSKMPTNFERAKNAVKINLQENAAKLGTGLNRAKGTLMQKMKKNAPIAKGKGKNEEVKGQDDVLE